MTLITEGDLQIKVVVLASGENVLKFTEERPKKKPTAKLPSVIFKNMLRAVKIFSEDKKLEAVPNHCEWSLTNEGNK